MPLDLRGPLTNVVMMQQAQQQAPAQSQAEGLGVAPWAALLGGQGADLATTLHFMSQGGSETNALAQSPAKAALLKGGGLAAQILMMKLLEHGGHPNIAKAVGYGAGGVGAMAALHNEFGTPSFIPMFRK